MPSCFQLTRKGDNSPSKLWDVDRAICQNCDIPYSEDRWACGWYDFIGLLLACGKTMPQIIDLLWEGEYYSLLPIAAYISDNYTTDAFYQHGWN